MSSRKPIQIKKYSHLAADCRQRVRVLDGLSREDGDFVAVDLDGPLRRR